MKFVPVLARLAAVAAAVAAAATGVLQPGAAAAHEGQGQFAVETTEPEADGVRYVVRLTWVGDNHPAIDATVTATPIDPTGTAGTPVAFSAVDQDGRYQGVVPLATPGTWTVRFTAVTPPATFETTREVATTTPSTTTTEPDDQPATTEAAAPASATDRDDGPSAGMVVPVVVVAALALAGGQAFRSGRRRRSP